MKCNSFDLFDFSFDINPLSDPEPIDDGSNGFLNDFPSEDPFITDPFLTAEPE